MLKLRRYLPDVLWGLGTAIALSVVVWFVVSSQGFRDCEQHQGQYPTAQNTYDKSAAILVSDPSVVSIWLSCSGGFANENGAAITALATIALVLSTILLWRVTKVSAQAGRDSVDIARRALTELERPFLAFKVSQTGVEVDSLGVVAPKGNLISFFENIGRTPAILIEHCDHVLVVPRGEFPQPIDPDNPQLGETRRTVFPIGVAIGPQLHYSLEENMIPKPMTDPLWYGFADNSKTRANLFVYGFLRYGDIFGGHYLMGYCAIFVITANRFIPIGGPEYNYFRKEQ